MQQQLTSPVIKSLLKPRDPLSHKGNYGHALLIAGAYGKIGAAVLAAGACLRSGVGLLTVYIPKCGYQIMQSTNPEAMVQTGVDEKLITDAVITETFSATGIGPGMGTDERTQKALQHILMKSTKPMVLDADALNMISLNKNWLDTIPENSILTPHPKEFERLAGKTDSVFENHALQISVSQKYKITIVLKGANTRITTATGEIYFNTTGNPGMAKGGSGDVLTGIITGLLAQGYSSIDASLIGVFVHGLAGDLAAAALGETGITAGDLCQYLPLAFKQLYQLTN